MHATSNASSASPPGSTAFTISLRELDGSTSVLTVAGELDLCSAPTLKWALTDALTGGCSELIVDLSPVTFIDSTALSVLVGVQRRLSAGARLAIVCANAKVLEIMELTGLVALFELFETLEQALGASTTAPPALSTDAAIALGMASTAMPFARSARAEAERWLRILRLHGDVGKALQVLGVGEAALEGAGRDGDGTPSARPRPGADDAVAAVTEHAVRAAKQRGAQQICTRDVFLAVIEVYGADFERVLRAHGGDCDEVLERLGAKIPEALAG